jgi:hypothetical protein
LAAAEGKKMFEKLFIIFVLCFTNIPILADRTLIIKMAPDVPIKYKVQHGDNTATDVTETRKNVTIDVAIIKKVPGNEGRDKVIKKYITPRHQESVLVTIPDMAVDLKIMLILEKNIHAEGPRVLKPNGTQELTRTAYYSVPEGKNGDKMCIEVSETTDVRKLDAKMCN